MDVLQLLRTIVFCVDLFFCIILYLSRVGHVMWHDETHRLTLGYKLKRLHLTSIRRNHLQHGLHQAVSQATPTPPFHLNALQRSMHECASCPLPNPKKRVLPAGKGGRLGTLTSPKKSVTFSMRLRFILLWRLPLVWRMAKLWLVMNNPGCRNATSPKGATPQHRVLIDCGQSLWQRTIEIAGW